jgi:hypothetical protein
MLVGDRSPTSLPQEGEMLLGVLIGAGAVLLVVVLAFALLRRRRRRTGRHRDEVELFHRARRVTTAWSQGRSPTARGPARRKPPTGTFDSP